MKALQACCSKFGLSHTLPTDVWLKSSGIHAPVAVDLDDIRSRHISQAAERPRRHKTENNAPQEVQGRARASLSASRCTATCVSRNIRWRLHIAAYQDFPGTTDGAERPLASATIAVARTSARMSLGLNGGSEAE